MGQAAVCQASCAMAEVCTVVEAYTTQDLHNLQQLAQCLSLLSGRIDYELQDQGVCTGLWAQLVRWMRRQVKHLSTAEDVHCAVGAAVQYAAAAHIKAVDLHIAEIPLCNLVQMLLMHILLGALHHCTAQGMHHQDVSL